MAIGKPAATETKFHLIIATELRRYFAQAGRGLPSEFMRSLFPDMCACHAEKAGEIGQYLTKQGAYGGAAAA